MTVETHRKWVTLVRHLDQALALLDALDEGDSDSAAYAQRAINAAKRELRRRFGRALPPLPNLIFSLRRPVRSSSR